MGLRYKPEISGKGISKEEKGGFLYVLEILLTKFKALVGVNALFCLFMLPIVGLTVAIFFAVLSDNQNGISNIINNAYALQIICTFFPFIFCGPAVAGITKITRDIGREEHVYVFSDFVKTFKKHFLKATVISFISYLFYIAGFFALLVYWKSWLFFAVAAFVIIYFTIMLRYVYLMLISLNLSIFKMFKNAFFLVLVCIKNSLKSLLTITIQFIMFAIYFISAVNMSIAFIFLGLLVLLILFSIPDLYVNYYCFNGIIEKVVDPYYKELNKDKVDDTPIKEEIDTKTEDKSEKYKKSENITERSEYVYVNGKLVKKSTLDKEQIFEDNV